ncbi:MAG: hypothetical protein ACJ749_01465 [Flavisolibacter sp.]
MKYTLCTIAIFLLVSCGKDKDNNQPQQPTKTELISKSSWKYESGGVDQDKNGTFDISFATLGILQPCILDNTATFTANGSGTTDEGTTKCNPSVPQTSPFVWAFANSETAINISGSIIGLGGQFKILALTDTKLSLSKDTTITLIGPPTPVALIVNLQH